MLVYIDMISFVYLKVGLATCPEIERTLGVRPLIGVVFNQQKLYIRNLHLYSNAPAQGKPLNFYHTYIRTSLI